ncbi:MAG: hypothetical protein P1U56_25645, partial [Saprospiraceae bacterium]|nr:hypothetical protein [Saprospiraceae bacterium]
MNNEKVTRKLFDATSKLTFKSKEQEYTIDSIRKILAHNLKNNLQDLSLISPLTDGFDLNKTKEETSGFDKFLIEKLEDSNPFLLDKDKDKQSIPLVDMRQDGPRLPFNFSKTEQTEWRWNQKREDQLGPFLTDDGNSIILEIIYYEDKLTVRSKNDKKAHFLFSQAQRSIWDGNLSRDKPIELKSGHIWIWSKLFSSDADDNSYVGFNIKKGSFSISNTKEWNNDFLDFTKKFSGVLDIYLEQPEANSPSFEGCKAAQEILFNYSSRLQLEWSKGELKSIKADKGNFQGFENNISYSDLGLGAIVDNEMNHIFIPCKVEPNTWKSNFTQSKIFSSKGSSKINESFWALPMVKVSNPATLGEPDNNGGLALKLTSKIESSWIGSDSNQPNAVKENTLVVVYPKALVLRCKETKIDTKAQLTIDQKFKCWNIHPDRPGRIPLNLHYKNTFQFAFYCHAEEGESIYSECYGNIKMDRPVYADGSLINFDQELKGYVWFQTKGNEINFGTALTNPIFNETNRTKKKLIALKNALLTVTPPLAIAVYGKLANESSNDLYTGDLVIMSGVTHWKPTLPDPYVSNIQEGWGYKPQEENSFSSFLMTKIKWDDPKIPEIEFTSELLLSGKVGIKSADEAKIQGLPVDIDNAEYKKIKSHTIDDELNGIKQKYEQPFDSLEKRLTGWKLLDVSTNMDLIGVSVSPAWFKDTYQSLSSDITNENPELNVGNGRFLIKDMAIHTPMSMVNVFTLPQVQWEPVQTLPEDQNPAALGWFPENLSSASDGGPSRLIGLSQELSPIIPDLLIHQIKDSFVAGEDALALTTLSFGLKAGFTLKSSESARRNADAIEFVQPVFDQKKMKGGIQFSLKAEGGNPKFNSPSPGFEGIMVQTLNGYELFTGTPLGISVLGATKQPQASVERRFNAEFGPDARIPFVPVTRFDLSGYGASNFSDWENEAAMASIGKVKFNITVGRTSFEVVKFVSKIYPWGITVTRSVTIERKSGGGLIRKDSGWQATESGIFNFILEEGNPNPFKFHPGVFRGCFNLNNIRPVSNNIIKFDDTIIEGGNPLSVTVELAPIYFDSEVVLKGQEDDKVFSKGILGFIQLSPQPNKNTNPWTPRLLSSEAFQKLIQDQGPIGGPLDTILNIDNSGFKFRASRFEVDVIERGGQPEFVSIVRGQPVLPNNGSWSVVKIPSPTNNTDPQEAVSTDSSLGTPLFIDNTWNPPIDTTMNVSPPSGPYRFADSVDLFAAQPRFDYSFMQNTGSQAFLYRRPVLSIGSNALSSILKPVFAGPFAMFTTKGAFPPVADAIVFPSSNYTLMIENATGRLKLNNSLTLPNPRPKLIIKQDGVNNMVIEYDQSELRYELNYNDWSAELDTFYVWTSMIGLEKLFGGRFSLIAGTGQQSKLVDNMSLMKKEIRDALSFIPGFGD